MEVNLVQAPRWAIDYPPIGLAYLSSYLSSNGFEAFSLDFNIDFYRRLDEKDRKHLYNLLESLWWGEEFRKVVRPILERYQEQWLQEIDKGEDVVVGFSLKSTTVAPSLMLADELKDEVGLVVGGGPAALLEKNPRSLRQVLGDYFDVVVTGEGEGALLEVVEAFEEGRDLAGIPGTIVNNNGNLCRGGKRPLLDLDTLPLPDFDSFDLDLYCGARGFPIHSSRGCPYHCSFCDVKSLWRGYRERSPAHVLREIKDHLRHRGITAFEFTDSCINANLERLSRLCQLLETEVPQVSWRGRVRGRQMSQELFDQMKRSGCSEIICGLESGSDRVLEWMRKGFNVELMGKMLEKASRADISVYVNLIVGFPTEAKTDFLRTFYFLFRERRHITGINSINICILEPHSDIHDEYRRFGVKEAKPALWETREERSNYPIRFRRRELLRKFMKLLGFELRGEIPDFPRSGEYMVSSDYFHRRGDLRKALRYAKKAARLEPDNQDYKNKIKYLRAELGDQLN